MKRVLVTGATGFVGNAVLASLNKHGYVPVALVRHGSENKLKHSVEMVKGDVMDKASLLKALEGIYAVVHLVGIIREYPSRGVTFEKMHHTATKNIVEAAAEMGIKRYIHMSANGTRLNAVSDYHITKQLAEDEVKNSGLDYTIFRPSLVYGQDDSFINMLAGYMKRTPVFSYFGDGSYPMQPVFVGDVAECFVKAIDNQSTTKMIYPLCGKNVYTYKHLLRLVGKALGKNIILLPVPEFAIKTGISLFGKANWFPITKDQFIMLTEGNTCSSDDAFKILKVERSDFYEKISSYL
ncbi:NAD-dependent epimerase/dehydratase [Denitrovibrio acetiphilus DSM 12809]|uniref:NAD-dependent epimerase/dehydratase n=1 Tax=Denitrovibrio acetiphilus (strain DSM 12809 / NBRC 114555 / N2460) TaxID=522772 RepID=D4H3V5_DENA2|nr:complex I NDUFA9 subunit family protein [Denitrovibrio acetiphilus]ADD69207.1 NAD-dependent epimerase/dehydratase [Denitrovibrio acetiphilus DSM 12809]